MNVRLAIALVVGLALGYGIANYGVEYLFPSPEQIYADIPADAGSQPAGNRQAVLDPEADRSGAATRERREGGTLRPARSGFAPDEMADWLEEVEDARYEGEALVDQDYELLLQKISETEEELFRKYQNYPDPEPVNLSDEELLAGLEAAIAEANKLSEVTSPLMRER